MALYHDTNGGPVLVELTGEEMTTRQGTRYVKVTGWLLDWVPAYSLAEADSPEKAAAAFSRNTIATMQRLP